MDDDSADDSDEDNDVADDDDSDEVKSVEWSACAASFSKHSFPVAFQPDNWLAHIIIIIANIIIIAIVIVIIGIVRSLLLFKWWNLCRNALLCDWGHCRCHRTSVPGLQIQNIRWWSVIDGWQWSDQKDNALSNIKGALWIICCGIFQQKGGE